MVSVRSRILLSVSVSSRLGQVENVRGLGFGASRSDASVKFLAPIQHKLKPQPKAQNLPESPER